MEHLLLNNNNKEQSSEFQLPIEIIHHIQSFLDGKQAAKTCILSKSWFTAWSTRPVLYLDQDCFRGKLSCFRSFFMKTVRGYKQRNLNVEKFIIKMHADEGPFLVDELINVVLELEPNELDLFVIAVNKPYVLPAQVFAATSLTQLYVKGGCNIGQIGEGVCCSQLTTLVLRYLFITDHILRDILLQCSSIENLELCNVHGLNDIRISSHSLGNLDLCNNSGLESIQISSHSLRYLRLKHKWSFPLEKVQLNVPNISRFVYKGDSDIPFLSVFPSSREWESDIKLVRRVNTIDVSWFVKLRNFLIELRLSTVSLLIGFFDNSPLSYLKVIHSSPIPVVEHLTVCSYVQSYERTGVLPCLFRSCHPKFITQCCCKSHSCVFGREHLYELLKHIKDFLNEHSYMKLDVEEFQNRYRGLHFFEDLKEVDVEEFQKNMMEWYSVPFATLDAHGDNLIRFRLSWRATN